MRFSEVALCGSLVLYDLYAAIVEKKLIELKQNETKLFLGLFSLGRVLKVYSL